MEWRWDNVTSTQKAPGNSEEANVNQPAHNPDELLSEKTSKSQLECKISGCYGAFHESWLQMQPEVLIERAEEIASVQRMLKELPDAVTEEDAAYLLRFKNPLEVVVAAWQEMNGSGGIIDDDMKHILWELRDRQDAEQNFEIEQEHFGWSEPSYPEMSM